MQPPREIALGQALGWILALAGSIVAFSWAVVLLVSDHEGRAMTFTAGGLALLLWAAIHLTDRRSQPR